VKRPEFVTQFLLLILIASVCWMAYRLGDVARRTPVDPAPPAVQPVRPAPKPEVKPELTPPPADTPLSRAMRDYLRQAPATLPDTLDAMADKLDSHEHTDKAASVAFFKKPAAAMNAALDQVFSPGLDPAGKVADPAKISGPLRESARALRRAK
jgi:hypothetical protein